jgi:hypothetical protein
MNAAPSWISFPSIELEPRPNLQAVQQRRARAEPGFYARDQLVLAIEERKWPLGERPGIPDTVDVGRRSGAPPRQLSACHSAGSSSPRGNHPRAPSASSTMSNTLCFGWYPRIARALALEMYQGPRAVAAAARRTRPHSHQRVEGAAQVELEELLVSVAPRGERCAKVVDRLDAGCCAIQRRTVLQPALDEVNVRPGDQRSPRVVRQQEAPDLVTPADERACEVRADSAGRARHQYKQVTALSLSRPMPTTSLERWPNTPVGRAMAARRGPP